MACFFRYILVVLVSVSVLAACGDDEALTPAEKAEQQVPETEPVEELYNAAMNRLQAKEWKLAKKAFEEVERQHPYSSWAKRAQVLNAYAAYENMDYEEAIAILERFVRIYPGDERVPYAYYIMALSKYEQISDVGRDQGMTSEAMASLKEVMRRYPNTDYARDAKIKLELTVDHLAGKEMDVGRYYLKRKEYLSAIRRFERVIANYQTTTHIPEALHRMVEAYLKLGVVPEAQKYAAVLGHNYPKSDWYRDSYKLLNGGKEPEDEDDDGWFGGLL